MAYGHCTIIMGLSQSMTITRRPFHIQHRHAARP